MQKPSPSELREALQEAIGTGESSKVTAVFERLALLDGYRIAKRARNFLEGLPAETLEGRADDPLERARTVTNGAFQTSVLDYVAQKGLSVDGRFDDDITAWIDSNAAVVCRTNLDALEEVLADHHPGGPEDLRKLKTLLDVGECQRKQQRILRDIWAGVETAIAEILSTDYT